MARYYDNRLSTVTPGPLEAASAVGGDATSLTSPKMSEFDRHRQTLLSDDAEEGWASELRRYLGTMQQDVKKDTDIIEWWQVRVHCFSSAAYLCFHRIMHSFFQLLHESR